MPYTTLGSATAGQVYTAAAHNAIIGNLNTLGPAVFNVQSVTKTDVFTTTSTSYTDVTGLSVSITPSSASSKVLVIVSLSLLATTINYGVRGLILRGSTAIGAGTAASLRPQGSFFSYSSTNSVYEPLSMTTLDSPATTSATTYKVQVASEVGGGAGVAVNRGRNDDNDNASIPRMASSITVIEVPV